MPFGGSTHDTLAPYPPAPPPYHFNIKQITPTLLTSFSLKKYEANNALTYKSIILGERRIVHSVIIENEQNCKSRSASINL